jgi:hypothetical protein
MSRPSFQFYPRDWVANAKLGRCTLAERGAWIGILCLLHDGEDYGILRWPLKEIAAAAGATAAILRVLVSKDVLKGHDEQIVTPFTYTPYHARRAGPTVILIPVQAGPLWYSSRMVRDEYIRKTAGATTRFGAPTRRQGIHRAGHQPIREGDGSASASASASDLGVDVGGEGSGSDVSGAAKSRRWS